jgi:hypothetical protein
MTATVLIPFDRSPAIELSQRLWKKRLLPVGEVSYKGRMLKFSREYLARLADAFHSRAYDQVPLQLAGDDNRHTNDVERYAGEVLDAEARDDGLWITVKATPRGERVLTENPGLGISARITEDFERSDGRFFPAAVQHVLATLDPRIPELGPWQAIEASNDGSIVIDLSGSSFVGGEDLLAGLDASPEERTALEETLDELLEKEGALERWAEGDGNAAIDSMLNAMIADPADYYQPRQDDLSGSYAEPIDLSVYEPVSAAIELAEQRSEQRMARTRMTRHLAREEYRLRGDMVSLMQAYVEVGVEGHPVELANRGAFDHRAAIELAATGSSYGLPCGAADGAVDAYGRCSARYHDPSCSHVIEASASYAARPQDAQGYLGVLQRYARTPLADADGRGWRTSDGLAATASDHFEAQSGLARRSSPFEPGPDGDRAPAVIERDSPYPAAARAVAAQFISQHMPFARPKDVVRERLAARAGSEASGGPGPQPRLPGGGHSGRARSRPPAGPARATQQQLRDRRIRRGRVRTSQRVPGHRGRRMALNRYVLVADVTVPADVAATVVAGEPGTGGPAGLGNSASVSPPTATKYGLNPSVKLLKNTPIVLDPAGSLFAAIGAGNLRNFVDGQDTAGHQGLSN